MKAMIFAAGNGTRLKPFTLRHPKALVEVGGKTMLERVITKLRDAGISEMVVNVHHFADQITGYLRANHNFGVDIHISDESARLLDTGGGVRAAAGWLEGDDFIMHNADILTDFPIAAMVDSFHESGSDATLLAAPRHTSRYLLFDRQQVMRGWTNIKTAEVRPTGLVTSGLTPLAFGGVHIMSRKMLPELCNFAAAGEPFSIIDFYLANCGSRSFSAFTPGSQYMWHDVGKPESLEAARREFYA